MMETTNPLNLVNTESFEPGLYSLRHPAIIEHMVVPEKWKSHEERGLMGLGTRLSVDFTPSDFGAVTLSVFYRGVPVSMESSTAFLEILRSKSAERGPEVLSISEILALTDVMNRSTVGDNQHSNPPNSHSNLPAAFKIRSAQTMKVNGKTVLEVEGAFQDFNGNSLRDFRGIYAVNERCARQIQQVFLQARPELFPKYLRYYKAAITSIKWR